MQNEQALEELYSALEQGIVPERDVGFVTSLVTQGKQRGLSSKQWYWVAKIAERLRAPKSEKTLSDFSSVYAMFAKAQEHLKFPKIHLMLPSGNTIKLYVSSARSRVPGVVNAVDSANDTWYGRIYQDGRWEPGRADETQVAEAEAKLKEFAADPEKVATEHGKLTGNCCFCNHSLKDDRSTDVGYGPVCAKRFGLDWGKRNRRK